MSKHHEEIARLQDEIAKLHAVRDLLGREIVDPKITALEQLLRPLVDTGGGGLRIRVHQTVFDGEPDQARQIADV